MSEIGQVRFTEYTLTSGQRIGHAILAAPASLNALTLEMITALSDQLSDWQKDDNVVAVVLSGQGEKGFCAGGDIRRLHASVLEHQQGPNPVAEAFFAREYRLDYLIHTFGKPLLCWGAGIVMGGGIGLLAGASHRIVTPSSKLAMPEISIGLFPDVGGSWILGRMPGRVGLFLGLTGTRLNGADALFCGLADRFLGDNSLEELLVEMQNTVWHSGRAGWLENHSILTGLLRTWQQQESLEQPVAKIYHYFDAINQVTDGQSPQQILANIRTKGGDWWQTAGDTLAAGCPTTAHIVMEQLRRGKHLSLADVFRMELNIAVNCLRSPNFAEGVRALLLERGSQPQWQPPRLADLSADQVSAFFCSPWTPGEHPLVDL